MCALDVDEREHIISGLLQHGISLRISLRQILNARKNFQDSTAPLFLFSLVMARECKVVLQAYYHEVPNSKLVPGILSAFLP